MRQKNEEDNKNVYKRRSMGERVIGVNCQVKFNTLKWFGHVETIKDREFTNSVDMSEVQGPGVRGMPLVKWENRVEEYMTGKRGGSFKPSERGVLEQGELEALLLWPLLLGELMEGTSYT